MSRRFTNYSNVIAASWSFDTSQDWSVCGWIYPVTLGSGGAGDVFFSSEVADLALDNAILLGYTYDAGNPKLWFHAGNSTDEFDYKQTITTGQWYHVALTYSAGTLTAYIDGTQVATDATVTLSATHDYGGELGDFAFGASTVELAQIKVWNGHALSSGELADEIDYWTPQTATGDVYAWWQLENASPLTDSSGNSHTLSVANGTPTNGSETVPGQLAPSGTVDVAGAMSAAVSFAAAPNLIRAGAGAITATATLAGAPGLVRAGAGAITATATLGAVPNLVRAGAGALAAAVTLAAAPSLTKPGAGVVAAALTLAAAPNVIKTAAGALSATLTMTGSTGSVVNVAGALTATAMLAGAPALWKNAAGGLSASLTMTGAPASIVNVTGALAASVTFSGAPQITKVGAGAMSATCTLAGAGVVFPLSQPGWTNPPLGAATPHGAWVAPLGIATPHGAWIASSA